MKLSKWNVDIERRHLLMGGAGAVAAAGLVGARGMAFAQEAKQAEGAKPLPDYVNWKEADALIVHSNNTLETKRDAFGISLITPDDRLYIRNNLAPPPESIVADRDAWKVEISGVKNPRTLTVGELKGMGLEVVAMVLQCSGNGRAFHQAKIKGTEHKISGTPWSVGAAGCVFWGGVPLRKVAEALGGVAEGAKYITGTGGEELPKDVDPKSVIVERSVPIDTLDTVLLAWEMNGEPISLAHGGPLRMIVPGYTGVNNVKYVKAVSFTEQQSDARIQQTRYRIYPIGRKATPEDPSVWAMSVKSWIVTPLEKANAGPVQIAGVAFGGTSPVAGVEVSTDNGQNWQKAEFVGPDLGPYAWRVFVLSTELKPGSYRLVSRATDAKGDVQPQDNEVNGSGYSHNGWEAHGVDLTVS